jgi:hypothetical protein
MSDEVNPESTAEEVKETPFAVAPGTHEHVKARDPFAASERC